MILLNGKELQFTTFPNGETKFDDDAVNEIIWTMDFCNVEVKYESDTDLIQLMFLKKHIDKVPRQVILTMKYFPYSRMDRSVDNSVFTLKYVAEFINDLNFYKVNVVESHSDVTTALLDRVRNFDTISKELAYQIMLNFKLQPRQTCIYFPDATAEKRYGKFFPEMKLLKGLKHRNFKTGEIESLEIIGGMDLSDYDVIMVDDLCSRGNTFYYGALELEKLGAKNMYLAVTHCEDTIEKGKLLGMDCIKKIYTTDSLLTIEHPKLHVVTRHV